MISSKIVLLDKSLTKMLRKGQEPKGYYNMTISELPI